jgi:hypothetical protein
MTTYTTFNSGDLVNTALSNGNLTVTGTTAGDGGARAIDPKTSGKWYVEFACTFAANGDNGVGATNAAASLNGMGATPFNAILSYRSGNTYCNNVLLGSTGVTNPTTVDMALDLDNKKVWFRPNGGNWNGSGTADPATNTGGWDISALNPNAGMFAAVSIGTTSASATANFGASAFSRSVPSGFAGWSDIASDGVNVALDSAFAKSGIASGVGSFTFTGKTGGANRILFVAINTEKSPGAPTVSSITDSAGLTWHRRKQFQYDGTNLCTETWWAQAPAQLTSLNTVTVTLSGTVDDLSYVSGAFFGAAITSNFASPFDSDASLPATATATSTSPSVTYSTSAESYAVVVFGAGSGSAGSAAIAPGAGYGLLGNQRNAGGGRWSFNTTEGRYTTDAQSSVSATVAAISSTPWGMVADAFAGGNPASLTASIADDTGMDGTSISVITPVTWDPANLGTDGALSTDKLTLSVTSGFGAASIGTKGQNQGKKYFELTLSDVNQGNQFSNWGVVEDSSALDLNNPHIDVNRYPGCVRYGPPGGGGSFDLGQVTLGFAVDFTTGAMTVYIQSATQNGVLSEVPHAVTPGHMVFPFAWEETGQSATANFGWTSFAIGLPSGYASWDGRQGNDTAAVSSGAPTTTIGYHSANITLTSDELSGSTTSTANAGMIGRAVQYSGKYYFEAVFGTCAGLDGVGITGAGGDITTNGSGTFGYWNNGNTRNNHNSSTGVSLSAYAAGDHIGVAVDLDSKLIWWRKNGGNWNGSGTASPTTGVGGVDISEIVAMGVWPWVNFQGASGDECTLNFGATAFQSAAPTDFSPWYKNDGALQWDFGVAANITTGTGTSFVDNSSLTSGNMSTEGARLIVLELGMDVGSGISTQAVTITDSAGLTWHKRQDVYLSNDTVRFQRWWAYSPNALTNWNYTVAWSSHPAAVCARAIAFMNADHTSPFDDGSTAEPSPVFNAFTGQANGATMTSTALTPEAQEVIVLGNVFLSSQGFDPTLSSGGITFEGFNSATFYIEYLAGQYYAEGVSGKTFSWLTHAGGAYALTADVLRAEMGLDADLNATFTDENGLTAIFAQPPVDLSATITDDNGISTAILEHRDLGDLLAVIRDDGGISEAILTRTSRAPPVQVVVVCS